MSGRYIHGPSDIARGEELFTLANDMLENAPRNWRVLKEDVNFAAVVDLLERSCDLGYFPAGYKLLKLCGMHFLGWKPEMIRVCRRLLDKG